METKITSANTMCIYDGGAYDARVEVEITDGIGIHIVGMPDEFARQDLLRVITAMQANGMSIPGRKVIINISCPRLRGTRWELFDLPVYMALSAACGDKVVDSNAVYLGEIGLDGELRECGDLSQTGVAKMLRKNEYLVAPHGAFPRVVMINDVSIL